MLNEFVLQAAEGAPKAGGFSQIFAMVAIWGAIIYFLMIRPNKKKEQKHREMIEALEPGVTVITSGGIKGEIVAKEDQFVVIRVDKGVRLTVKKASITSIYTN